MKTLKIKLVGFWSDLNPDHLLIIRILKEKYEVVFCDDPDYIICSCFAPFYEYCKYPQVRIMVSGENYIPDFNLVDYAICPYPITFLDRCFYKPQCFDSFGRALQLEIKIRNYYKDFIKGKEYFANFIASHESEYNLRGDFFKALCKYKRVESPGTYLNNMNEKSVVTRIDDSKTEFQRKCKFTLCFESTKHEGFVTEKITEAFFADTIPVYYGSDTVKEIFNPKAFINVSDFTSFDEAIEYIKKVDQDDDLYLEIMNQPILNDNRFFSKKEEEYKQFLDNIFNQPLDRACRRSRVYVPKAHEDYLCSIKLENKKKKLIISKIIRKMKCFFRKK